MFSPFDRIVRKCVKLGNSFPIMPIEEIRLAVAFAELPGQGVVVSRLLALFDHENMHVRRIAINACRRSRTFDVPGLREGLTRKLSDQDAWVRYDAAWAIHEAQFDTVQIRNELAEQSAGVLLPHDEARLRENPSDALLQARVRAKQALLALQARVASLGYRA